MKKKILFLITKSNWGGAQRYVFDIATSLDLSMYEPVVALGGDGPLATKLKEAGVATIPIPGLKRDISLVQEIKVTFAIAAIIRKEKPDVLHVNSSKAGFLGTALGRILRVKNIIFTAHGWAFNEDRSRSQKIFFKIIHWLTVLFSHQTITVSRAVQSQMDWPLVQNKLTVINPGRSLPKFLSKSEARGILETKIIDSVANLSDYHKDTWVGTIAELHPIKQLHTAINAIAALSQTHKNIRYVIIGDGQLRHELMQQVHDLGIEKYVFFTGSLSEAARFLSAFDVFILPSKSESFGYVLLEAGLAQVPIITTRVGGILDIITDNETGLLTTSGNTTEITEALSTLVQNKKLRQRLVENNVANVQCFSLEKMMEQTTKLYQYNRNK